MTSRPASTAVAAAAVAALWGCGTFLHKYEEYQNPQVDVARFDSVAVISGSDEQGALQMAARARSRLEEAGVQVVHVRGLWATQLEALDGVCTQFHANGLVVVEWNRLTLRDCETRTVAFDVQGGFSGVDRMADRLVRYLRKDRQSKSAT